jgi:hypothetical protein
MLPAPVFVQLRFTGGPSFGNVLVLGNPNDGILGSNVLGTTSVQPVNITDIVQQVSIRRGRNDVLDAYQNGTATVQLLDRTGDYNPENTAGPYFGQILPNRQLRIGATYQGNTEFLFSGYVESWDYQWRPGFDAAIVTITASDAFRLFNLADVETVPGAAGGDTAGERVAQILDAANWPQGQRRINPAGTAVQNDSGNKRAVLAALQQIEATELGAFFIDAAGNAVFETRAELSQIATQTPVVFTDNGTGPGISYQQLDVVLNDQLLANEVTVERAGGSPQTVSDAASIAEFFKRSLSRTGTLNVNDTATLGLANSILNNRKSVGVEVKSLTFEMISDEPDRINAGLTLEFSDPIQVTRTQPGGSTIDATLVVQGIAHDISPSRHNVILTTSRPLSFAFVLGSPQYGVLGTSTL